MQTIAQHSIQVGRGKGEECVGPHLPRRWLICGAVGEHCTAECVCIAVVAREQRCFLPYSLEANVSAAWEAAGEAGGGEH